MLEVRDICVSKKGKPILSNISFTVGVGEVFCILGESGAGKSTLLKVIMGIFPAVQGTILFEESVRNSKTKRFFQRSSDIQLVMQDPLSALNPTRSLLQSIEEPLKASGISSSVASKMVIETIEHLELTETVIQRSPLEVSLGQAQRACLARALVTKPKMILFDEPLSALDAPIRRQTAALMMRLQSEFGLTFLIVTHDLGFAKACADQIALMKSGQFVELKDKPSFFASPSSDYAKSLIQASQNLGAIT